MSGRLRVGMVIDLDDAWLGGLNYYRNLVTAIYDDPGRDVDVVLLIGEHVDTTRFEGFPTVEIVRTRVLNRHGLLARVRRRLIRHLGRDLLLQRVLASHRIDVLSHAGDVVGRNGRTSVVAWIPDFQHLHLPAHFTEAERADRNARFARLCNRSDLVILSSESARGDLLGIDPALEPRTAVLRFVPKIDVERPLVDRATLEQRYGFDGRYFYLPNQYWAHKNHRVVIEALGLLAGEGKRPLVISTGSPSDYRNPGHYAALEERIDVLGIGDRFLRLGVVPYADLLALMKHSLCVINPSLFEGWSTTVEEARAMGKPMLLSDIAAHREQAPEDGSYFRTDDARTLADAMWQRWSQGDVKHAAPAGLAADHEARRRAFAAAYADIVRRVAAAHGHAARAGEAP